MPSRSFAVCWPRSTASRSASRSSSITTARGRAGIYLEDLYVDESARGTGTGTLLLKTVAAIAHAEGCKRMSWQALDWFVCGVLVVTGRGDGCRFFTRAVARDTPSTRLVTHVNTGTRPRWTSAPARREPPHRVNLGA